MLGADDGDRTRVTGLGNQCSTIELHPQFSFGYLKPQCLCGFRGLHALHILKIFMQKMHFYKTFLKHFAFSY